MAGSTSSSASMDTPPAPIVFDVKRSDLRIDVGDGINKVPCMVDSKALVRASPAFDKMLFGGFAESRVNNEGEWVVNLPDDDVNAMAILFDIIHGHVHKVPKTLPKWTYFLAGPSSHCYLDAAVETDMLYLITTAADKYGLMHLLVPWVKYWVERICCKKRWWKTACDGDWCPELLWSAYLLGDPDLLNTQVYNLLLSSRVSKASAEGSATSGEASEVWVTDTFGNEDQLSEARSSVKQILEILDLTGMYLNGKRSEGWAPY